MLDLQVKERKKRSLAILVCRVTKKITFYSLIHKTKYNNNNGNQKDIFMVKGITYSMWL